MKSKKVEATLESIKIRCPKSKKLATIPAKNLSWNAHEHGCDLCGSHGDITITITCTCNEYHDIELESW